MKKPARLGKGLDALIRVQPESAAPALEVHGVAEIPVDKIRPNPYQPRVEFDPEALEELKNSIREKGIIQPITVRRVDDHYELIAGERRFRALTELQHKSVPAHIIEVENKEDMLELAIIENVQREKLNPIELAQGYQRLIEECNLTQDDVAQKIGKDRTTITNFIRLLKLPEVIKRSVQKGELSMGHARTLLAVDDPEIQELLWQKTLKSQLSVRQLEKMVKDAEKQPEPQEHVKPKRSVFIQTIEDDLREKFGTKVKVHSKKEGGSIEIDYYSPEDLNRIIELFEGVGTGN